MNSLDAVTPAREDSMNVAWIAGRFLLVGLVLSVAFVSLGSDYSRSSLYDNQESGGYASDETQELVGDPEDLVKDWEKDLGKPKFVLMVTGRQHGYIEPCGCITLARQKGGCGDMPFKKFFRHEAGMSFQSTRAIKFAVSDSSL